MIKRLAIVGVLLLVLLGIAAPYIQGDRYGQQIREALERGLHRKVEIGAVHFNLFTGPGFSVEDVIIYDDPSFGIEPLAHMAGLEARVRLSSLFTGTLDFSTVRFLSPSLNVVKPETGTWNVVKLLQDAKSAQSVPEIQFTDGKIYLKNGTTKSAFYIAAADVTVSPRRDGIGIRFEGEPARTDRSARAAGSITARGVLSNGALDLDIQLENSPVDELGGLLRGRLLEYHGSVSTKAKLKGPLTNLTLDGSFTLADVHRWDLMSEHDSSWTVRYKGSVDTANQRISIATIDNPNKLHFQVSQLLSRPQWALDVAINELSAASLVNVARDLGAPVPDRVSVAGKVMGALRFGSDEMAMGELHLEEGSVRLDDGPELKLAAASLSIDGDSIRLQPVALAGEEGQGAQLEGEYNTVTRTVDATIRGQGLRLLSRAAVPLVTRFQGGKWSAALAYRQTGVLPPMWSGSFDVRDTLTRVPGMDEPLRIVTARIEVDGDVMKVHHMHGVTGKINLYGSYAYLPGDPRPHRFDFMIPKAALSDIEQTLGPALRRDGGFFARTLRLRRAALPDWLEFRKAEGVFRIGVLTAGDLTARGVRSRIVWDGAIVQLTSLQGRLEEGSFKGAGTVDITKSEPQYKLRGQVRNLAWKNGKVDLEGSIDTLGTGLELLLGLRGQGEFEARNVILSPEQSIRAATGEFTVAVTSAGPQFRLSSIEASLGTERFTGDGGTLADGRMQMELASANRTVRVHFDVAR